MKRSLALASAVILLGAVSACGGDDSSSADDYCGTLEDAQEEFGGLEEFDVNAMESLFSRVSEIADTAPEEIAGDWETVEGAFTSVQETLDEVGLTMEDLQALQEDPTNLPDGVDQAQLMEAAKQMQELSSQEVQDAMTSITDHAEQECDLQLEGSGSGSNSGG